MLAEKSAKMGIYHEMHKRTLRIYHIPYWLTQEAANLAKTKNLPHNSDDILKQNYLENGHYIIIIKG